MREKLLASGAREAFQAQIQETLSKKFSEEFRREAWIPKSRALAEHLDELTPSNGEQNS